MNRSDDPKELTFQFFLKGPSQDWDGPNQAPLKSIPIEEFNRVREQSLKYSRPAYFCIPELEPGPEPPRGEVCKLGKVYKLQIPGDLAAALSKLTPEQIQDIKARYELVMARLIREVKETAYSIPKTLPGYLIVDEPPAPITDDLLAELRQRLGPKLRKIAESPKASDEKTPGPDPIPMPDGFLSPDPFERGEPCPPHDPAFNHGGCQWMTCPDCGGGTPPVYPYCELCACAGGAWITQDGRACPDPNSYDHIQNISY